jgi:hypothetical protein
LRTLALPNRRPSTKPESRSGRDEQEAQPGWVLILRAAIGRDGFTWQGL